MELDERKKKILNSIIKSYLKTGEPVGSRTISKEEGINISSATIRNEMADLEEMGYIIQPHTSSGRIPTDAGYRLYVDQLMQEKKDELDQREKDLDEMKDFLDEKVEKVEQLLENTAKLLANDTNYATMVTSPVSINSKRLKFIQLSLIESKKILCVIVTEGNRVRNRIINVDQEMNSERVVCYVPSSSHLGNYLNLYKKKVLLIPTSTPTARTPYALFAVPYKKNYIANI